MNLLLPSSQVSHVTRWWIMCVCVCGVPISLVCSTPVLLLCAVMSQVAYADGLRVLSGVLGEMRAIIDLGLQWDNQVCVLKHMTA